ncbi:MAG: type II toxin-antitoxin system RelE/ParE family toxin [Candidatus Omnitrophica bacterium]|nr:type II toxin-antitoxin system RelE/ParE family toxin [Candidatus Omnitrophota bacterium]
MDKVIFLDSAIKEFELAVNYYNAQSEGLGFEFALEIRRSLERIVRHPLAWHPLSVNTRRCRTNRFPYGLVYHQKESKIIVVAVMHLHQAPRVWE